MYKVLIVDDEPFIVEGLRRIIEWDEYGIEIVGHASDGLEAINIIEATKINILLTDIRMPNMNGLELIKQIRKRDLNIYPIILSGYDDFEYIKEAIKLGIENYLLKPVNKDELSITLLNTIEKIENYLHKQISDRQGLNIFRENILCRWLSNSISSSDLLEKAQMVNINLSQKEYVIAVLRVLNNEKGELFSKSIENNLILFAIQNICSELTCNGDNAIVFNDLNGDIVFIFPGSNNFLESTVIIEVLKNCISHIKNYLKLDVFISVGSIEQGYVNASKSYTNAKNLQNYSMILSKNSIIDYNKYSITNAEMKEKVVIDFRTLNDLFNKKAEIECINFVNDILNQLRSIKGVTPNLIQNVIIEILHQISNTLKSVSRNDNILFESFEINLSDLFHMKTIEELSSWLKLIIEKTIFILNSEDENYSPIISQVLNYIKINYNKDISIKHLSSHYSINAAYLGQLFKTETGELLTNYLNNIRIEKAKQLLMTTKLKVNDISEKVGYINTNYFYRIFKKITGVSPTDYR